MRRVSPGTGLEGAPDIMLLTMAALMVAIVWLASLSHETALPPIDLPSSDAAELGARDAAAVSVTLRAADAAGEVDVFLESEPVAGGLPALATALEASGAGAVTLRADAETRWQDGLTAMSAAARLGLPLSVAVDR